MVISTAEITKRSLKSGEKRTKVGCYEVMMNSVSDREALREAAKAQPRKLPVSGEPAPRKALPAPRSPERTGRPV